jgi:hypothetical protein
MNRHAGAAAVGALVASAACYAQPATTGTDASSTQPCKTVEAGVDASGLPIPASCPTGTAAPNPPTLLTCTGLYADFATTTVASQARPYAPAVGMWADGATAQRWIYLPPGKTINTTDSNEWTFPVGTRAWSQFSRGGSVVETRYFEKQAAGNWAFGTYAWIGVATGTSPSLAVGGNTITLADGSSYYIPMSGECSECHAGRTDSLLGFEQVSLGLSGATGLTLAELVKESLLSPVPASTSLTVGDDGTKLAAPPLAWMHANCGTSCHNTNPNAFASAYGMDLRLEPTLLDGRSSSTFPSIITTVGVAGTSGAGGIRIVAGDPEDSLVYQRIDERGTPSAPGTQMPPIDSLDIDTTDVATVAAWISAMKAAPRTDAGADAATDAARDSAPPDANAQDANDGSVSDSGMGDSSVGDATVYDGTPWPTRDAGHGFDGPRRDSTANDGTAHDAPHADTTTVDSTARDSSAHDSTGSDAAQADATPRDAATHDSTAPDAQRADAGADATHTDTGVEAAVDANASDASAAQATDANDATAG